MAIVIALLWLFLLMLTIQFFAFIQRCVRRKASEAGCRINYFQFRHSAPVPKVAFWENRFNFRITHRQKQLTKKETLFEVVTGFQIWQKAYPSLATLEDLDDAYGGLWQYDFSNSRHVKFIHVINSTPEPDGSYSEYDIRVPNTVQTAQQAVAWTFGMERNFERYKPRVET